MKCVFRVSLQILCETFFILRRTERDIIKMYIGLRVKYPLFLSDFNESWIFEKYSNMKFHENLPSGSRISACGRTDVGQT